MSKIRKFVFVTILVTNMVFESSIAFAAESETTFDSTTISEVNNKEMKAIDLNTIASKGDVDPVSPELLALQFTQWEVLNMGLPITKYKTINILGDSITEGVGASADNKTYPAVLSKLTGAKVNNYGVSGSRITDVPAPTFSFVERIYNMDKSADLIIVFGGTNDFWCGDCPIGKRSDTEKNTFYGALNIMMKYFRSAYPNAEVVFITPYKQSKGADETHEYKTSTYGNFGTGTLGEYRTALLDRCQYYGIPCLDLYADDELNTVDNREALQKYGQFLCDGCHLNDAGYNLLARKIYKWIMQDFDTYVPEYVEVNDMVFETAALPALISEVGFTLPNGSVVEVPVELGLSMSTDISILYHALLQYAGEEQ